MKVLRQMIAGIMAAVLVFSGFVLPEIVYGTEIGIDDREGKDSVRNMGNELSIEGTNSFGNLLAESIGSKADEQKENNGYNVFGAEMADTTAVVSFETLEDCMLVVGVYEEDGIKMLHSGSVEVFAGETEASVEIETESMPQYFFLRCFLIDSETLRPLCTAYESPNYTQEMQKFLAKTTNDFDADRVLNLDEDTTNNFAVYDENTKVIPQSEGVNQVVSSDDGNENYVIEHADESITSLQTGDIFSYEQPDGNVLIVKVEELTLDTSDETNIIATITSAETSMEEVFDYVKINGSAGVAEADVDPSNLEEGVSYDGIVDYEDEVQAYAFVDEETKSSNALSVKWNKKKVSGKIEFKVEHALKLYISSDYQYAELKVTYSAKAEIACSKKIEKTIVELPAIKFRSLPCITVELKAGFVFEVSGKLNISGKVTGTAGFAVSSDEGSKSLTSSPKLKTEAKGEVTVFLGLSFEIEAKCINKNIASAKASVQVGKELKGNLVFQETRSSSKVHACNKCIDGELSDKREVEFEVSFLKEFKAAYKNTFSKKVGDFYYSFDYDEFAFATCPHYKFKTTITVLDDAGNKTKNAKITAPFSVSGYGQNETVTKVEDLVENPYITTGDTGVAVGYLSAGSYVLEVSADGYKTKTKKITVKDDSKSVKINLKNSPKVNRIKHISVGEGYSGAVTEEGHLYMWGANWNGGLGDGTTTNSYTPNKVMDNVDSIKLGSGVSGAVTKNLDLYMWGDGIGTTPTKIMSNVASYVTRCSEGESGQPAFGAIDTAGQLFMWGEGGFGQLGSGEMFDSCENPKLIMGNVKSADVAFLGAGAITEDGSLYMWGNYFSEEGGNGPLGSGVLPAKVMGDVKTFAIGGSHFGAVTEDGSLYMWGSNYWGELGNGTTTESDVPVKVLEHVASVSLGSGVSAAITEDGSLYMWGSNYWGQLGNGTTTQSLVPIKIMDHVIEISVGSTCCGAITKDGSLYMWGNNNFGQLGDGTTTASLIPIKITFPSENSVSSVGNEQLLLENHEIGFLSELEIAPDSENPSGKVADYTNLLPNEIYNFYIMKSKKEENLLSRENLLYLSQAVSDGEGRLSIDYEMKEEYSNPIIFVVGSTRSDISLAQVRISDLIYNGKEQFVNPQVSYNTTVLTEGEDFELEGEYSATEVGTYTVTIRGIGNYTGSLSQNYRICCEHSYEGKITKSSTCMEKGCKTYTCSVCGDIYTEELPLREHTYGTEKVQKKATTSKGGSSVRICAICGSQAITDIARIQTVQISAASYIYNGKVKTPSVTIKDGQGKKLKNEIDYTIIYPKGRKNVGKYTVTINFNGKYSGTVKKIFTILPKTTSISKITVKQKGIDLKWRKQTSQTTGYQIQYSTSRKFAKKTTKEVLVKKNKTISTSIVNLKAKKKYYVRIRTYKTVKVNGKSIKLYSEWSKVKKVTVKK